MTRRGEIVKTGVVLAVAMTMAAEAAAGTQTSIRTTTEQQLRQEKISIMEGTLTSSVDVASKRLAKDVKSIDSTAMLFAGRARAKGFTLEGHGVFFYVEVPTLDLTVMMTVQQFEREQRSAQQRAEAQPGGSSVVKTCAGGPRRCHGAEAVRAVAKARNGATVEWRSRRECSKQQESRVDRTRGSRLRRGAARRSDCPTRS